MSFPAPTKTYHKTAYSSIDPCRPELSAKGKTILITGGGTGIGAATAKAFAQAGASCIGILGRREQPLLDTKTEIEAEYPDTKVLAIPTDVAKKDEVDAAFAQIAASGKVDILVSNAAVLGKKSHIVDMTAEDVSSVPVRTTYETYTDFVHQYLVPFRHHPQSQRQFQRRADLLQVRITRRCPHRDKLGSCPCDGFTWHFLLQRCESRHSPFLQLPSVRTPRAVHIQRFARFGKD
jgi:hypothetical protein